MLTPFLTNYTVQSFYTWQHILRISLHASQSFGYVFWQQNPPPKKQRHWIRNNHHVHDNTYIDYHHTEANRLATFSDNRPPPQKTTMDTVLLIVYMTTHTLNIIIIHVTIIWTLLLSFSCIFFVFLSVHVFVTYILHSFWRFFLTMDTVPVC